MKKIICILICVLASLVMIAQDKSVSLINKIKLDSTYIYGEVTHKTCEEASSQARELLKRSIKEWIEVKTKAPCTMTLNPLVVLADSIVTKRANMIRYFLYIKKSDLMPILNRAGVMMDVDKLAPDTIPIYSQTIQNEQSVLKQILSVKFFHQLKGIIEPLYQNGYIKNYGKYANMRDPSKCYLIIYSPDGDIRAFLGKGTSIRKNLITGTNDSEHNYSGCGAIWLQLNY